jgi:dTDP-4-dehydrorhamnose reductase
MRIVIIGSNSNLGNKLIKRLVNEPNNYEIKIIISIHNKIDYKDLIKELINFSPDIIFYFPGISNNKFIESNIKYSEYINFELPTLISGEPLLTNSKIVAFSSTRVFDEKKGKYQIDDLISPTSLYGFHKAKLEKNLVSNNGIILRMTKVLSEKDKVWKDWLDNLILGNQPIVHANYYIAPITPDIITKAIINLIKIDKSGIYQISSSTEISFLEIYNLFVKNISEITNKVFKTDPTIIKDKEIHASLCSSPIFGEINFDLNAEIKDIIFELLKTRTTFAQN